MPKRECSYRWILCARTAEVRAREALGHRGGAMQDLGYELPRILIPRTWVNKGKKEGRGCPKPRPSARDALAYLEEPCLLLCEGVAHQVLRPRGDHRLVGDPTA